MNDPSDVFGELFVNPASTLLWNLPDKLVPLVSMTYLDLSTLVTFFFMETEHFVSLVRFRV